MDSQKEGKNTGRAFKQSGVILTLGVCTCLGVAISYVLYNYTEVLLKERLQERLVAIVATTAKEVSPNDIRAVQGVDDLHTVSMENMVGQLQRMREANSDITYAYIMRKTDDPDVFEFIADADSLIPQEEWDLDGDGEIEDDEAMPLPGDPFETQDYPILRNESFIHPIAAHDLEQDQWSVQLSAYAPIKDESDTAIAIIGIDVTIDDFKQRTQAMLLPFLFFILALIFLLTFLTLVLVRMYSQRVEFMKELDRQKDELLSIVSHQLATPVSSFNFSLEMLLDGDYGKLSKEQSNELAKLQRVTHNLTDLINMILDVSRVQLGRLKINRGELELELFVSDIVEMMKTKAIEQKVTFDVKVQEGLPNSYLDKRLMRMTMENLLSNAIKYTPEGGKVTFKAEVKNNTLHYIVRDTGCGIPKEEHDKMFTKLYRATNVRNSVNGNGFGLYVARGAVLAHGGEISFESEEGKGTVFRVSIPLQNNPTEE